MKHNYANLSPDDSDGFLKAIQGAVDPLQPAKLYEYFHQDPAQVLVQLDSAKRKMASRRIANDVSLRLVSIDNELRAKAGVLERVADLMILGRLLRLGRVVLVCGAGVSSAAGLPGWKGLVLRCLTAGILKYPRKGDELTAVTKGLEAADPCSSKDLMTAANTLAAVAGPAFSELIRDVIYSYPGHEIHSWQIVEPSDLHNSIVQLGYSPLDSGKAGLSAILTYNFDDLLEAAFRFHYLDVQVWASFAGEVHPANPLHGRKDALPVWHMHGWVPRLPLIPDPPNLGDQDVTRLADLVFSEESYELNYSDERSLTREVHNRYFSTPYLSYLFLGSSFTDDFQLKQLHRYRDPLAVKYAFMSPPETVKGDTRLQQQWYASERSRLARVGVRPITTTHEEYVPFLQLIAEFARL